MTGFLPAAGTVDGSQSGVRRSCAGIFVLWRSGSEFKSHSDGTHFATRTRLYSEVSGQNSKSCRSCYGIRRYAPRWMSTRRQSRRPNMQLRQPSGHWCFQSKRTEPHNHRQGALHCEKSARRERTRPKGTRKRAQKRALLGPQWFQRNPCNPFGMNGGDDETRTRDLCRDSPRKGIAREGFRD
jgi:hypothetical protein